MKKNILSLAILCSSIITLAINAPARAGMGSNTIGPSLLIRNGSTSIGADAKFGISDNLSVRPFAYFPDGLTVFGAALTYEFEMSRFNKSQITPYLGGGISVVSGNGGSSRTDTFFTGGADFGISDNVDLKAALDVPLSSSNATTGVRIGAGFKF